MSPGRGPSHRPSRRRPPRSRACPPPVPRIFIQRLWAVACPGAHPSDEGLVAARGSRVLARPTRATAPRATALRSARRAPRGNDARATVHPRPPPRKPPARALALEISAPALSQRGRENLIVASVSSIPRPGADLRPDPSSHARTGPTTKTRWTTAPISRRRASPSARSSSTRTRLARPGSRRTPRARRTALGSTLTCGAASITAWRPSCSRTRSEGRDVAARAPLLLIVSTTLVSSGGDGPFNSFQSRVVCIRRPGRVYKSVSTRAKSQ